LGVGYSSRIAINPKNPATDIVNALESVISSSISDDIAENTNISNGKRDIPFAKSNPVLFDFSGYCFLIGSDLMENRLYKM
jgi:hypothetical protein